MNCDTNEGPEPADDECPSDALYLAALTSIMDEWSSAADAEAYDDL
jgi:hypothetical protein